MPATFQTYLVGGAVHDRLLGLRVQERSWGVIGRLITVAFSGLLVATPLAVAATDSCPPTTSEVRLPTTRPSRCIAVRMDNATVVLDMSLVKAHGYGTVATHPGNSHLSRWNMKRANQLLQAAPAAVAGAQCARVDGSQFVEWLHYVALQIDNGKAVVYASGSDVATPAVTVRDRPVCGGTLGGMGTRGYFLPSGRWFLALITGIS